MTTVTLHERELNSLIGKLFCSFPKSSRQGVTPQRYVEALSRFPLTFVREACEMAVSGRLNDCSVLPPVAQLAQLAGNLHARSLNREKKFYYEPEKIYDKEERCRVVEGFKRLLTDLRTGRLINPDEATAKVYTLTRDDT